MAKHRSPWRVDRDPDAVQYDFFISHVGEDSDDVGGLKACLTRLSEVGGKTPLTCFLDVDSWQIGNEINGVIKNFMLKSRFMLLWVTPAYLETNRGWVWWELAYADLIESSQNAMWEDCEFPYIVPVFQCVGVDQIDRTPLFRYWTRRLINPTGQMSEKPVIARKLLQFHEQEMRKRDEMTPPRTGV